MPSVCWECGAYEAVAEGCRACGTTAAIGVQPVIVLTGASGVGKTAVSAALQPLLPDANVFDTDALLGLSRFGAEVEWESWLLVAHAGAQGGRATVLCGTVLPAWFDGLDVREVVGPVVFGLLHCSDEVRAARLRARPAWRQSSHDEFVDAHAAFAADLLSNGWPTFDTAEASVGDVAQQIAAWVRRILAPHATSDVDEPGRARR